MKNKEDNFSRLQISGYDASLDAFAATQPFQPKVDRMRALLGGVKAPARLKP